MAEDEYIEVWRAADKLHQIRVLLGLRATDDVVACVKERLCMPTGMAELRTQLASYVEEYTALRAELEAVKAECDAACEETRRIFSGMLEAKAELASLRAPETRRVRVIGWDVTAEDIIVSNMEQAGAPLAKNQVQYIMDYLATRAVIDVPRGVPTLDELKGIAIEAYNEGPERGFGNAILRAAAAIRDAVIAGLAPHERGEAELEAKLVAHITELEGVIAAMAPAAPSREDLAKAIRGSSDLIPLDAPMISKRVDAVLALFAGCAPAAPTEEQIEALARVLHAAYQRENGLEPKWEIALFKDQYRAEARAAYAHFCDRAYGLERENKNLLSLLEELKEPSGAARFSVNAEEVIEECGGDTNIHDLESYIEFLLRNIVMPAKQPIKCIFCDFEGESLAAIKEHSAACVKHPLWREPMDPDAWKTPLKIESCLRDSDGWNLELYSEGDGATVYGVALRSPFSGLTLTMKPADAVRASLWLASYAAAHGCPVDLRSDAHKYMATTHAAWYTGPTRAEAEAIRARKRAVYGDMGDTMMITDWLLPRLPETAETPKGLPTVGQLLSIFKAARDGKGGWDSDGIMAILVALRPYLHTPVGWELDVTAEELATKMWGFFDVQEMAPKILDLCRSRIRPTFECKECAKNRHSIKAASENVKDAQFKLAEVRRALFGNAARAALEGE